MVICQSRKVAQGKCPLLSCTHLYFWLDDTLVLLNAIAPHEVAHVSDGHHQGITQVSQNGDVIGRLLKGLKEIILPIDSLVSKVQETVTVSDINI